MIIFKRYGHTFKIKNDDWKKLRMRFDPENARLESEFGKYYINLFCSLCSRYKRNHCIKCPFEVLEKGHPCPRFGCSVFFDKLLRFKYFSFWTGYVSWEAEVDKEARKQLKRMQKIMDKIEEENK